MSTPFYVAAAVALLSTALALTRANAIHALLYFAVSLLAVALVFLQLGAAFVAALEVIVYAGAIVVLFLFTLMLIPQTLESLAWERYHLRLSEWLLPLFLAGVLAVELLFLLDKSPPFGAPSSLGPVQVGMALFGPYLIGTELGSLLLLSALVSALHLGRARTPQLERPGPEGSEPKAKE